MIEFSELTAGPQSLKNNFGVLSLMQACGSMVNSGPGGVEFKPCPSRCFLTGDILLGGSPEMDYPL